ncbi:hypothetical protein HY604_01165 [Candidatus Peregrinibacteria bacterium]|nr:hypothetical protein [Candidatus Peregrinibacteria bacterium]
MKKIEIPKSIERVLTVATVLIFISALIIFLIGNSLLNINTDIKQLEKFNVKAEETKINFEKSLQMYTEQTSEVIKFLLSLRPENEEQYIRFIAKVEQVAQNHNLKIKLTSVTLPIPEKNKPAQKYSTLNYQIDFYGNIDNLKAFLAELENLPYFIEIAYLNFKNPELITAESEGQLENINLKIKLYIK